MFLFLAASVHAQAPSGIVLDPSGGRVAGASVVVHDDRHRAAERILTTSSDGSFAIADCSGGRQRVTVLAPGFSPVSVEIDCAAAAPREIPLAPAPVVEFVPVVSASRIAELRQSLNTRVEVVSRATLEESSAQTVAEALRDVPGVLTRRGSESAGVAGEQIQGIDSRQVLVLLDGQPLAGARGIKRGAINLDRQSVGGLDRIEVIKGASSALYGSDAIGGVVSLITRDPAGSAQAGGVVSGGSAGAFDASASAAFRNGRVSGLFNVAHHQGDGFDLTPTTFDTTGAPFRRRDGLGKLRVGLPGAWSISALANGYANRTTGRSNGELGPQEDSIHDDTINAGIDVTGAVAGLAIQARAYSASYDEDSTGRLAASVPVAPGSLEQRTRKLDMSVSRALGRHQFLQAGVEWMQDTYAGINRLKDDNGVSATTGVVWAQHRLAVGSRITTTLGLRVDDHSAFGTAVSPKAAANIRLGGGVHARASYGRGFRAPDLGQLYYRFLNPTNFYQVIGNPSLEPEHADSVQIGVEYLSSGHRARAGANLFHNDVRDLIDSTSLGFVATSQQLSAILAREGLDPAFRPVLNRLLFTYKNLSHATTRGVEVDGEVAATRSISISAAYTFLDAFDATTGVALTGRTRHQGQARIAWRADRSGTRAVLQSSLNGSWIAARARSGGVVTDTAAPAFVLWDAYVSQRLRGGLVALAAVDNLTDSQDPNTGVLLPSGAAAPIYRPEIGRAVRFGLRWSWNR